MTGMEFIPELIGKIDPAILEAATKGLATAIGKVAGESGIKLLGGTGEQILDGAGKLTKTAQDLLFRISRKYIENYTERHGILKVLGMPKPVSLDSVYTAVKLLNPEELKTFESVEALESEFRQSRERGFQSRECSKQSGISVANQEQYLMVLGSPGMGKTTFLRKVSLEALKGSKGDYTHNYIPVLLELKTFRTGEIDFENALATEFQNCGLPEYQQLTNKFLEQGKLLVLLDGLDEVPTERIGEMVTKIQDFVDRHRKNRFITSCRIAAYRNNFRRFTDVAIADFDDGQIENFIINWFVSNPERGQECLAKLNSGDYQAAKELTRTPLLLTLVCILYQRSGQFPTNRSTLYERALRVLLEEWNGAKEIPIEQLYKGLDTKRKELILSQIAYNTFIENQLFFPKRTVVKQIEQLLPELLPDEKFVDGNHVLKDIEVQHGLLVERAEGIYSFSHLTIQEFLTAQHIDYNNIEIEPLIDRYLCDSRWREVFLLLSGLRKADSLLLAMEKKINSLIENGKLNNLLFWAKNITNTSSNGFNLVGKRSSILHHALSCGRRFAFAPLIKTKKPEYRSLDYYEQYKEVRDRSSSITYIYQNYDSIEIDLSEAFKSLRANNVFQVTYHSPFTDDFVSVDVNCHEEAIKSFNKYIEWSEKHHIYRNVDFSQLISMLEIFNNRASEISKEMEERVKFSNLILSTWLKAFCLDMKILELSELELQAINNYIYSNLLMIECKKAAVRLSPEVWEGIESRMLLPAENAQ